MSGRQAKLIAPAVLQRVLRHVKSHPYPLRSRAIILLSAKAGLRAAEIARLEWPMVLDANGKVGQSMAIEDRIAKKKSGRRIPIHPALRLTLVRLHRQTKCLDGPVIRSRQGGPMRPNSIVNWFIALYAELELKGCSSHSGRRTFVTQAARLIHKAGGSLRDVQLLAGHRSIETTQRYIDGDTSIQRRLIALL